MNALRNKVQLIGRLGQDPDLRTLESGKKVAHFTLATSGSYKSADGSKIEETTWHSIVAWNGLAEISSKFLRKGREVCVEGRITYRTYTDKNGIQKSITEIIASDMVLLSSRTKSGDFPAADDADLSSGLSDSSVDLTAAGEAAVRNGKTKSKVQAV
jgi:single-strand DNA-binding protein